MQTFLISGFSAFSDENVLTRLVVLSFSISIDGYGAGPNQDMQNPLGVGGGALHEWVYETRTFQKMHGNTGGNETGIDEEYASKGFANIGAWIMGRSMFGPVRGPWPDLNWKGWWGDNPPYHTDVYVLTHYSRPPLSMEGGTTFHFVTDGIDSALRSATAAAKGMDVRLGGGVAVIREYLRAGLVDEMHLAITPVVLGKGEHLLQDIDLAKLGYRCVEFVPAAKATHIVLRK